MARYCGCSVWLMFGEAFDLEGVGVYIWLIVMVDVQKYRLGKQLNRDAHLHGSNKDGGK